MNLAGRSSGILLHPTSFPGRFGIGEIGPEADRWLEQLAQMRQRHWQVLPLGPTGFGDSPYQTLSTFAGNPLVISFDRLRDDGLVDADRLAAFPPLPADHVAFGDVIGARLALLHEVAAAFPDRAAPELREQFGQFADDNRWWLDDYALFVSLKAHFAGRSWTEWPSDVAPLVTEPMSKCTVSFSIAASSSLGHMAPPRYSGLTIVRPQDCNAASILQSTRALT